MPVLVSRIEKEGLVTLIVLLECWDGTLCVLSGRLATASTKFAAGHPNLAICIRNDLEGTKSRIFLVEHAPSHP